MSKGFMGRPVTLQKAKAVLMKMMEVRDEEGGGIDEEEEEEEEELSRY